MRYVSWKKSWRQTQRLDLQSSKFAKNNGSKLRYPCLRLVDIAILLDFRVHAAQMRNVQKIVQNLAINHHYKALSIMLVSGNCSDNHVVFIQDKCTVLILFLILKACGTYNSGPRNSRSNKTRTSKILGLCEKLHTVRLDIIYLGTTEFWLFVPRNDFHEVRGWKSHCI